jgi:hypothetical protein
MTIFMFVSKTVAFSSWFVALEVASASSKAESYCNLFTKTYLIHYPITVLCCHKEVAKLCHAMFIGKSLIGIQEANVLALFSWAHAQKQDATRRPADGKGPPADSNGPSADGKGPPAGANRVTAPSSHPQSNGLLGEYLLSIVCPKGEPFQGMLNKENGWENILRVSSYLSYLPFQL